MGKASFLMVSVVSRTGGGGWYMVDGSESITQKKVITTLIAKDLEVVPNVTFTHVAI